jgi:hypothetical protein
MSAPERPTNSTMAILEWAALAGLPVEDATMAERIAAGASAAARAVEQIRHVGEPLAHESSDYLACLERLAGTPE